MNSENNIFAKFKAQKAKIKNVDSYFTPSKPIEAYTHLKGRDEEVQHILGTLTTAGQHCMIYGERGIGKSSLALSTLEGGKKPGYLPSRFSSNVAITKQNSKTSFNNQLFILMKTMWLKKKQ
ncbi:ATP-binding protein [Aeromonas veronii]